MKNIITQFLNDFAKELDKLNIEDIKKLEIELKQFIGKVEESYNSEKMKKIIKK